MTDHRPRLFESDAEIRRIGEGMIACSLPKSDWTHEAHLAACLWMVRDRPDIVAERDLPVMIPRYNESVGGVNSDTEGYHETITQVYVAAVRDHLSELDEAATLLEAVNALLVSARLAAADLFKRKAILGGGKTKFRPAGSCCCGRRMKPDEQQQG